VSSYDKNGKIHHEIFLRQFVFNFSMIEGSRKKPKAKRKLIHSFTLLTKCEPVIFPFTSNDNIFITLETKTFDLTTKNNKY